MSMTKYTRDHIEKRAKESGIAFEKLGLEPDWPECEECNGNANGCIHCEGGLTQPEYLRSIAVIYDGVLDEEFELDALYAAEVTAWVAETCRRESEVDVDHPDWEVILSVPTYDNSETIHRIRSEN